MMAKLPDWSTDLMQTPSKFQQLCFIEMDKSILKFTWDWLQRTQKSENNLEKKEQNRRTPISQFQNVLQSYSNQDCGGEESRNQPTHLWPIGFRQRGVPKSLKEERLVFSPNGAGPTGIHVQNNASDSSSFTPHIKMNSNGSKTFVRAKTAKLIGGNTGINLCDFVLGNGF